MKKLTILAMIVALAICGSAMALSITITGQVVLDGVPLDATVMGPAYDYESIGDNPLLVLNVNGSPVAQTTVGAGQYLQPVNGMFSKGLDISADLGDVLTVTAYAGPTAASNYIFSGPLTVDVVEGGTPADYIYDFATIGFYPLWPEPSVLLTGLVLFLVRRKK
jgi:hypothetical protein